MSFEESCQEGKGTRYNVNMPMDDKEGCRGRNGPTEPRAPHATSPASLVALSPDYGVHLSLGDPHQLIKLAWNKSECYF